ncbi:filamentous hemagglutinin N-terminal domain-containing protein [Scytonema sp. NUACC26]|uniref:two-partner secretion domain-containing protein n=1 Tax=Scytonema sp. NUACC26 TaxID=3140176 RepID=UPI0034DCB59F
MHLNWWRGLGIANGVALFIWGSSTSAQIIPDTTLPENSRVRITDNIINIEGGTLSGSNLFHSFSKFSVQNGTTAYFNNVQNIQNIITRITGQSISNIDGLIKANGTANLFLINPNGIVLGQNARLDIGGSFFATTANSVKFTDGLEYSATPQTTPLLTVSTPIGLQFGANPGLIQVRGDGQGIRSRRIPSPAIDTNVGLRVQENQTLALVGGDISLEGATIKTAGGRIELGSASSNRLVSLVPTEKGFALSYGDLQNLGNIRLSQQTAVDATGEGGGDVRVTARSLKLSDGSVIETSTLGSKLGGNLTVNTLDEVYLSGVYRCSEAACPFPGGFYAQAEDNATGTAGDVTINTRLLQVQDGAQVSVVTKGAGRVGNLTVNADTVNLIDNNSKYPTGLGIQVRGSANATTELKINTRVLTLIDGALVDTSTLGSGNGANLTVNATESVQLISDQTRSALNSQVQRDPTTGKDATGNAGNLIINTRTLRLDKQAQISASTLSAGRGGNILVNASDSVQLFGSAVGALGENTSTGRAGDVLINTNTLTMKDGARVLVRSRGRGNAGNLNLNARSIFLDRNSFLDADTRSVTTDRVRQQANININSASLVLRRGSRITANATGIGVVGGNINMNTDVLAAFENSDITANSNDSQGGKVKINTQSLISAQFRNLPSTLTSDITAIGKTPEFNGTVQVNTPDIDPSQGLVPLTVDVVDVGSLVDDNICTRIANSSFTYTGRGGLPPSPNNTLSSDPVWEDWRLTAVATNGGEKGEMRRGGEALQNTNSVNPPVNKIIEAQGWVVNSNGDVVLVANAPAIAPHKLRNSLSGCEVSLTK